METERSELKEDKQNQTLESVNLNTHSSTIIYRIKSNSHLPNPRLNYKNPFALDPIPVPILKLKSFPHVAPNFLTTRRLGNATLLPSEDLQVIARSVGQPPTHLLLSHSPLNKINDFVLPPTQRHQYIEQGVICCLFGLELCK